ncbi:MAG: type II toxin-antitoxin system HigB family toxin [Bacteroidales bacterium]|nr:type II toxin-antitoxin system HigB family toxin [Bacteroidales bacterium]
MQKFTEIVEDAEWQNINDIKADFNSVDYVSNERNSTFLVSQCYSVLRGVIFPFFHLKDLHIHPLYSCN